MNINMFSALQVLSYNAHVVMEYCLLLQICLCVHLVNFLDIFRRFQLETWSRPEIHVDDFYEHGIWGQKVFRIPFGN